MILIWTIYIQHQVVLIIESWHHLYRPSLISPLQLFSTWIYLCLLPHRSQIDKFRIFYLARLLLFFNDNIRAFLQKLNIFDGRQTIRIFQFLIVVLVTFPCSEESSVFSSFNFLIDFMISFWIWLSSVDFTTFIRLRSNLPNAFFRSNSVMTRFSR